MESDHDQEKKRKLSNSETTRTWMDTLKRLVDEKVFNCEICGAFFGKTIVFSVNDVGTVCQECQNTYKWKGQRLKIFDVVLQDLPIAPCTNAGCDKLAFQQDIEVHLKNCVHRHVNCISSGCLWRDKLADLVTHFEEVHKAHVIGDKKPFDLDISGESFVVAKLLHKSRSKYFVLVARSPNSNDILYKVYSRVEDCSAIVDNGIRNNNSTCQHIFLRHYSDVTQEYIKRIVTVPLQVIDRDKIIDNVHKVSVGVLKEISGNKNTVKVFLKEERERKTVNNQT